MSEAARRWLTWGAAGLAVGLLLGLLFGWWLWPLRYADALPASLQGEFHDDYVLMVAQAFALDGDLAAARDRLEAIDATEPALVVVAVAERLRDAGDRVDDLSTVARLAAEMALPPAKPDDTREG